MLTLYFWKGLYVARALPKKTYKQASAATLERRLRLGLVSGFLQFFKEAIAIGYPRNRTHSSNMNIAVKTSLATAVVGSYPDLGVDPAKIQLSNGALSQVYHARAVLNKTEGQHTLTAFWQNPQIMKLGLSEFDKIQLVTLTALTDGAFCRLYQDVAFRRDGSCTLNLPKVAGISLQVWMFILAEDGKQASATKYLGNFTFE